MIWQGLVSQFKISDWKGLHYVYLLSEDPFSEPFYVGKGKASRAKGHRYAGNVRLKEKLKSLSWKYYVSIVSCSKDENVIFQMERTFIEKFGIESVGGSLMNIYCGRKGRQRHFRDPKTQMQVRLNFAQKKGKPFFASGFVFPSKSFAFRALGLSKNSLKTLIKQNKAFLLDEDWEEKDKLYISTMKEQEEVYVLAMSKLKENWKTTKVMISGIVYNSMTEAALANGVSIAAIGQRIKRGNQKDTYIYEG